MTEESTAKTNNLNEQPSNNTINTNDNNTINNTTPQDQNEQNKPNLFKAHPAALSAVL